MAYFTYSNIKISGLSTVVPQNKVDMKSFYDLYGEAYVTKATASTGIQSAHRVTENQTASDLGFSAAKYLLTHKNIDPQEIGIFVFVTQSPDFRRPSSASILHGKLGLSADCAAMEINLGCSGFIYGLQTVASMLSASTAKYGLLVLAETASRLVNPKDKSVNLLYGDGGSAILLEKTPDASEIQISLHSDGSRYKAIILPAGGFRDMNPPRDEVDCADGNTRSLYDIHMDGTAVFSFTITDVPASIKAFLEHFNTDMQKYDYVFLHQANEFIIKQFIRKFKLDKNRVPVSLDRYGNTGAVSIPLSICDRLENETEGTSSVFACGFGIGLSWGIASFELEHKDILQIQETDYFDADAKISLEELRG